MTETPGLSDALPRPWGDSEGNVVVGERVGSLDLKVQKDSCRVIEKLVSIHENHVSPHPRIQLLHKPRLRGAGDCAGGNDEDVIKEHLAVRVRIEDRMLDRHFRLSEDVRNVLAPSEATGVDLLFLDLRAEVEPVPRR